MKGKGFSIICFILSIMALLTILCFIFPEYLTTPAIRSKYPIPLIRNILYWVILISLGGAFTSLILFPTKKISILTLVVLVVALALGGAQVPLKKEYDSFVIQIGLDWFLLDLFILAIVFIPLERIFPRWKKQKIIRPEFKIDLLYFAVGHIGFQLIALLSQNPADMWLEFLRLEGQHRYVSEQPLLIQILLGLFVGDLTQYWIHRTFHQNARLWEFHKIHHSIKSLDWLAGSRLHLVDIIFVRTLVYITVMYLGLSAAGFSGYVLFMAFQTVFIHANIRFQFGWLRFIFTTPQYHHWHHNDRPATYDKNFAVHFPLIDKLFGTYYLPKGEWPSVYGVEAPDFPNSYWQQFIWPFKLGFKKNSQPK